MSGRPDPIAIEALDGPGATAAAPELADVVLDVVAGGASVGFMADLDRDAAERFWLAWADRVARDELRLLVARVGGRVAGTVSVVFPGADNQPHRFDIAKMQVHSAFRRRGVARALLDAAEGVALAAGRTVGVLDTVTGSDADRLYRRGGWTAVGEIPDYALWPDGRPCPTTLFTKRLD